MTKYCVIDTETSGLFDFSKEAHAEGQPRLASLAMILVDGESSVEFEYLVKPEGWSLGAEMEAVNGLTQEMLDARGLPVITVLNAYSTFIKAGYVVVAHNAQYDTKVMRGELRRAGLPDLFEETPNLCTMRLSTQIVKSPKANGKGYKFPKQAEAYAHFAGEDMPELVPGQSKALRDARACLRVLRGLIDLGGMPEPEVHYAKNRPVSGESA